MGAIPRDDLIDQVQAVRDFTHYFSAYDIFLHMMGQKIGRNSGHIRELM